MRRLWLLSSFIILVFTCISVVGCKAKRAAKKLQLEEQEMSRKQDSIDAAAVASPKGDVIIHKPGVIDQKMLDSIKAVKRKQKREIK